MFVWVCSAGFRVRSITPWVCLVRRVRPGVRWVRLGSSVFSGCAFRSALRVAGLFRVLLVRPGAPRGLLGSFGFVWLVRVRPVGCLVLSGWSSFGSTLRVAGFGRVRLVCSSVPRGSLGSFGLVLLVWIHPEGRLVHASTSSGCALGVAGFVRVRVVRP